MTERKAGKQEQHLQAMASQAAAALARNPAAPASQWMPPPEAARRAVRMRWRRLDPQELDDALQAFFLRTLEDAQRRVAPKAQAGEGALALGDELLLVFRNALHRARSRRMTPLLLDDPDHGAHGVLARLHREDLEGLRLDDPERFLGGLGGDERLGDTFEALWRLSPAQLVLVLELGLLGGVDTRAWTEALQAAEPGLTPNACAVRLSKAKAWALYRFCALHFGLRERWRASGGEDVAWDCFSIAYLRGGVEGLKAAAALAKAELAVAPPAFRVARDRVALWSLNELRTALGDARMDELEGSFRQLVLHLED